MADHVRCPQMIEFRIWATIMVRWPDVYLVP